MYQLDQLFACGQRNALTLFGTQNPFQIFGLGSSTPNVS